MSDLIYREDVIEEYIVNFGLTIEDIERIPAIDIQPVKHGHWERHNIYHGDDVSGSIDPNWRCSECGGQANINTWYMYDLTNFCPHCGAKMDQE